MNEGVVAGDSEGLYHGEYLEQEQLDCLDVFSWIERQSWSNGAVNLIVYMYRYSHVRICILPPIGWDVRKELGRF